MGAQVLDLTAIIRKRVGGVRGKLIPGFLLRYLERLIRQRELNDMLRYAYPAEGSAFSARILEYLDITVEVDDHILEGIPPEKPLIFASNHPLGGLDGIALVKVLGERYGDGKISVLVNDMLMNVAPLRGVFLPVNKYGRQQREAARHINSAYESGRQMVIFPAGLVSRLQPDGGIRDLEWQKAFVAKALEYGREIVPVRFEARNTMRFYRTAKWRKRLGLKVNIEQALLPSEVVKSRGKTFRITFLPPVNPQSLKAQGMSVRQIAAYIQKQIYS